MKAWKKALLIAVTILVLGGIAAGTFKVALASGGQPSVVMVDVDSDGTPDYQVTISEILHGAKLDDGTMGLWVTGEVSKITPLP